MHGALGDSAERVRRGSIAQFTQTIRPVMADHIRYDLLTQQALRGVVRSVLATPPRRACRATIISTFPSTHAPTACACRTALRAQYPDEMTIILQHQFWDLKVSDDGFEVGLSFGGVPERLAMPFEAINGFFDPSVQFGLQFEEVAEGEERPAPANVQEPLATNKKKRSPSDAPASRHGRNCACAAQSAARTAAKREKPEKPAAGGGEVVRLDRFRKK